jgi:tetratricopeptide (TPR) repeat protein
LQITHTMEVPLDGRRSRAVLLIVSLAISATIIWQAGRFWLARHRMESGQISQLESSAALAPGNGEVWDRLGRLHQWDLADADLPLALSDFRKSVEADPLSAHNWMDLAGALEASGDVAGARQAFERAQAVYPKSAEVAFTYGNFLLRQDDPANGYRELRRAAGGDAALLPLIISRAWRSNEDVSQLLDQVLPQSTNAYLQALDFFRSIRQPEAALAVWSRLMATKARFPLKGSFPLMDELIDDDRSGDALRVWREAIAAAGLPYSEPARQSLVWNGNFRSDFANGGLDWRWWPINGALMDFDSETGPNGSGALRFDFSGGANPDLPVPFEYVPVEPSRAYHFHAYLRTEQVTTESGIRFQLADPNHGSSLNLLTDSFTGSHRWSPVDVDLTTGPDEHFLVIRLVRYPSKLFDNKLGGTAWVADVSLVPATNPSGSAAR